MIKKIDKIRFAAGTFRQWIYSILDRRIKKPNTLQLPITGFCNSKCLTCNVWKKPNKRHINADGLRAALSDPFFADVESVGINGGELTLVPNFFDIIDAVLTLPKLKTLWLISNCLLGDKLLNLLSSLKEKCSPRCIKIGITLSIDGIGSLGDRIRGIPHAFDRAEEVVQRLNAQKEIYCDYCDIGCTVSKYNASYLVELEDWAEQYKSVPVYFHLAVPNKRIGTFKDSDYSVFNDSRAAMLAAEFFFSQYQNETRSFSRKLQMWANFHYLTDKRHRRMTTCSWLRRDVTIDEELNLYYCATASEKIGNLSDTPASILINSALAKRVRQDLKRNCDHCIHYSYSLSMRGLCTYIAYSLREEFFRGHRYEKASHS